MKLDEKHEITQANFEYLLNPPSVTVKAKRKKSSVAPSQPVNIPRSEAIIANPKGGQSVQTSKPTSKASSKRPSTARRRTIVKSIRPYERQESKKSGGDDELDNKLGPYAFYLDRSLKPVIFLMRVMGRFPVEDRHASDGTYIYYSRLRSPIFIYFILTSLLLVWAFLVGSFNIFVITVGYGVDKKERNDTVLSSPTALDTLLPLKGVYSRVYIQWKSERILIERHLVFFILVWSSLLQIILGIMNICAKHVFFSHFLTFLSLSIQTMRMEAGKRLHKFTISISIIYFILLALLIVLSATKFSAEVTGGPLLVATFFFRNFMPELIIPLTDKQGNLTQEQDSNLTKNEKYRDDQKYVRIFCGVIVVYILACAKISLFLYIYVCALLKRCFAIFNGRLYNALLRSKNYKVTKENRSILEVLFSDHCTLIDLMEGLDKCYSLVLEGFFALQIGTLCFLFYFVTRTGKYGLNYEKSKPYGYFIRPWDWAPGLIVLVIEFSFMVYVGKTAAEVGEEAMAGMQIVRRRKLMARKDDRILLFVVSMMNSFTAYKKLQLLSGGFFYINKSFLLGLMSITVMYFIFLYQFELVLDHPDPIWRNKTGEFLFAMEVKGSPYKSYWKY